MKVVEFTLRVQVPKVAQVKEQEAGKGKVRVKVKVVQREVETFRERVEMEKESGSVRGGSEGGECPGMRWRGRSWLNFEVHGKCGDVKVLAVKAKAVHIN